jgi:hypothetical protein
MVKRVQKFRKQYELCGAVKDDFFFVKPNESENKYLFFFRTLMKHSILYSRKINDYLQMICAGQ